MHHFHQRQRGLLTNFGAVQVRVLHSMKGRVVAYTCSEKVVVPGQGNCICCITAKNLPICSDHVGLRIDCDAWKGIIQLHVQFCETPNVPHSFHTLLQSILGFHISTESFLLGEADKDRFLHKYHDKKQIKMGETDLPCSQKQ